VPTKTKDSQRARSPLSGIAALPDKPPPTGLRRKLIAPQLATPSQMKGSVCNTQAVGEIRLLNQNCVLICVSDREPLTKHKNIDQSRTRFQYAPREITHFEFGGKLFALCVKDAQDESSSTTNGINPTTHSSNNTETMRQLLTNRELQIVHMVCHGLLTKQIADRLNLSEFTVKTYLKSVFNKLGVKSRAAMVFRCASWIGASNVKPTLSHIAV
jgi:DNA-binding CsgD family transcriptional regulator